MTNSLSFALHINEHAFDHKMIYVKPVILGFRLIKKKKQKRNCTYTQRYRAIEREREKTESIK